MRSFKLRALSSCPDRAVEPIRSRVRYIHVVYARSEIAIHDRDVITACVALHKAFFLCRTFDQDFNLAPYPF